MYFLDDCSFFCRVSGFDGCCFEQVVYYEYICYVLFCYLSLWPYYSKVFNRTFSVKQIQEKTHSPAFSGSPILSFLGTVGFPLLKTQNPKRYRVFFKETKRD